MSFQAVAILLFTIASIPISATPTATSSLPETTEHMQEIIGLDTDPIRLAETEASIARFADAGLDLPAVTIEFHQNGAPCNGHDGFIRYVEPILVINICSDRPYVLPHELAHAWVDANVSEEAKAEYSEAWGLASWNDKSDDWNDRGTEHAAFVVQQNLTASPRRLTGTWQERADAFEQLTGQPSPLRTNDTVLPS
jgi:hypothetical protein